MRSKIALMLAIWLGGFGCLLCCGMGETRASVDEYSVAPKQDKTLTSSSSSCCKKTVKSSSCKMTKSSTDHCNKPKKNQPDRSLNSKAVLAVSYGIPAQSCMMCCPIKSPVEPARTFKFNNLQANSISILEKLPEPVSARVRFLITHPPPLTDQSETYLHCCVFLI
jgi:hypothetical protein